MFTVNLLPRLAVTASISDSIGCLPFQVQFNASTNIVADSLLWTFGDGNSSNNITTSNIYTQIGVYDVVFIAIDSQTCNFSDTAFAQIEAIDDSIHAQIQIDTLFYDCDSLQLLFSSLNANVTQYFWNFDNGITSSDSSVIVSFSAGNYSISYQVTDNSKTCFPIDNAMFTVNLLPRLAVTASISDSIGCLPFQVQFNASTSIVADSLLWTFGDGNSSTIQNTSYTYTTSGIFNVQFLAYDTNTCNLVDSANAIIITNTDDAIADVSFIENKFNCDSLQLIASNNQNFGEYTWYFGDGTSATGNNISHTYINLGDYEVVGILYDSTKACNPYDTIFYTITFQAIMAQIALNDSMGCIPFSYQYNTNTFADNYLWDFDDGSISTQSAGNHIYNVIGIYTISLLVSDTNYCNVYDTAFAQVFAENTRVLANFNAVILNQCDSLLQIQVNNLSINATEYEWYLDGVLYSILEEPGLIAFNTIGLHQILLVANNDSLCNEIDSIQKEFTLLPNVAAYFNVSDNCEKANIIITNSSILGTSFFWNFGNGQTSIEQNPVISYTEAGNYTIYLTLTDSNTCNITSIFSQSVEILPYPIAFFETDSPYYVYPDIVTFTNLSSDFDAFEWQFGDGEKDNVNLNPQHVYQKLYDLKPCLTTWNAYCEDTFCLPIYMDFLPLIGVPNAFSPNQDGVNDIIYVEGIGIESLLFKIYNRWGELVFESNNQSIGWDGTYKDVLQEMEVYTYTVNAVFINGEQAVLKGNITLMR